MAAFPRNDPRQSRYFVIESYSSHNPNQGAKLEGCWAVLSFVRWLPTGLEGTKLFKIVLMEDYLRLSHEKLQLLISAHKASIKKTGHFLSSGLSVTIQWVTKVVQFQHIST